MRGSGVRIPLAAPINQIVKDVRFGNEPPGKRRVGSPLKVLAMRGSEMPVSEFKIVTGGGD
jgi:hypothetical protein